MSSHISSASAVIRCAHRGLAGDVDTRCLHGRPGLLAPGLGGPPVAVAA